jgi:molybdopterin-guanine dinucleotide biosynthesis protein A
MLPATVSSAALDPDGRKPLGAILAGGASRRFGSAKALAVLGGSRVIDRLRRAIGSAGLPPVMIANHPELVAGVGLPSRADSITGGGPLAGIHAALVRARDEGRPGALCVACDMPFVSPMLLARLVELGMNGGGRAIVPESVGRRGIEPLCAYYPAEAAKAIERMLREGERRASQIVARIETVTLPLDEVRRCGDPETMFLNVNTPDDLRRAEQIVREPMEGA